MWEQVLTNSNYIVRKVGTNYTRCVHRIRLRPIKPQYQVEDLPNINSSNFIPDPITRHFSEPSLFDSVLPDLLQDKTFPSTEEGEDAPNVLFYHTPRRVAPPAAPQALPSPPPQPPQPVTPPNLDLQAELPINNDFSLRDIILDSDESTNQCASSSIHDNPDFYVCEVNNKNDLPSFTTDLVFTFEQLFQRNICPRKRT